MERSAQPSENMNLGIGFHNKGDINRCECAQDEAGPAEERDPGAEFFGFFFIHRY